MLAFFKKSYNSLTVKIRIKKMSIESIDLAKSLFAKRGKNKDDFLTSKELGEILTEMNAPTTTEQADLLVIQIGHR